MGATCSVHSRMRVYLKRTEGLLVCARETCRSIQFYAARTKWRVGYYDEAICENCGVYSRHTMEGESLDDILRDRLSLSEWQLRVESVVDAV